MSGTRNQAPTQRHAVAKGPADHLLYLLMFGLGIWELLIILFIVLLLFGRKLPEVGEGLGKAIRGFRKSIKDSDEIDVTPDRRPDDKSNDPKSS